MTITSTSVSRTISIGRKISSRLGKGDIVCLFGELGSGKTVVTKGIALGLGIPRHHVVSPTFVLIREYAAGRLPLYHFDLYRISTPDIVMELGYEEYLYGDGISVIEWPERLRYLLPKEYLKIEISMGAKNTRQRLLKFEGVGARYKEMLDNITFANRSPLTANR